ncbi:loganic acid O-methyltransferase-like [Tripterygium wilfordii]|uniref:loganic acid O-methyltransferase-like n=1 Tax=Tripterygium wilfordii TaxID=458696 RepID=UPI0018F835EB|nr:loganic acid O-methyltransferase-like [Tripterygium wilfordii]
MDMESTTIRATMNGGDGQYSYTRNSGGQRRAWELLKDLIVEEIAQNLDVIKLFSSSSSRVFRIADFGCSVGPNTFIAVQNILDSVKNKYQSQEEVDFQVFFNDKISNDFNTLFKNLPLDRQYFVAAVPGFFQDRLFPKSYLHFVHCSYSLQWLSNVPKEVLDKDSPAYNKGKVFYSTAANEVYEAYEAQFAKDITSFLNARAEELVHGGFMALLIPCLPDGIPRSQCELEASFDLLGASLIDMVKEGIVSEALVDSFNLPCYNATSQELKGLIEKNACFSIERMETIIRREFFDASNIQYLMLHFRAVWEGLLSEHFGYDIIDDLFDRFAKKILDSAMFSESSRYKRIAELLIILKRNDA